MSRVVIPVVGKTLWTTGDVKLRVDLDLDLKDKSGTWHRRAFRVDTGTDITTFPAYDAKGYGLPLPLRAATATAHTQSSLEVRSGHLRCRIVGMDATEYVIPCLFLGDPNTKLSPVQPEVLPHALLQPLALLFQLRFLIDNDPVSATIYGQMVVEKE